MRKLLSPAAVLIAFFVFFPFSTHAQAVGWLSSNWQYRVPITITNTAGSSLTNFQVHATLGSSFDFTKPKSDGSDIRLTASDGVTQIPFWVESWNAAGQTASIWFQAPSVPTTGTTVYLYYANPSATSASNGDSTFMFFDDFESPSQQGYWTLGSAQTELVQDQSWEVSSPHTLSVQKLNTGGHTYWGYYGLQDTQCGGIGLAFSEDLVTWTKYTGNPLFTNGRWANVIQVGSTYYMTYDQNYCGIPQIILASSTDGIHWTTVKTLVSANYLGESRNESPNIWLNPNDGKYYLYWYNGNDSNVYNIMARSASSPTGLDSTASEVTVLTSPFVLAAPNMLYYNGTYFLATEVESNNSYTGLWNVRVYSSTTGPTSGFTVMPGNPVMADNSACMFQSIFGTTLHEYYCHLDTPTNTWTIQHRQTDITSTRPSFPQLNASKWTSTIPSSWSVVTDTQQNGTSGGVAQGATSGVQILQSTFTGGDYILEAYGKQVAGNVWGLGLRVADPNNFYSVNLYDNLNASPNLYTYNWASGTPSALGSAAVGTVNTNTWYKLSVRAQGSSFDIYKDGVFQIHAFDATHATGAISLYGESGTLANFNNVLVRQFASADPTSSVGTQQTQFATIASLMLSPASVTGGSVNSTGTVTLTVPAPTNGATVTLTSSNTAAATVLSSVSIASGATTATFTITSKAVASTTTSLISGTLGTTASATLTVTPAATRVSTVTMSPASVVGGVANSTGTITLNGTAPSGGAAVTLVSSVPGAATVPSSVTVLANTASITFAATSIAVNSATPVTITATYGTSANGALTVNPPVVSSVTLNPTTVTGGVTNSTGTVNISAPAPVGGALVALTSSVPTVATVLANVTVPAGLKSVTFPITSQTVTAVTTTSIIATYNTSANATLTVTPVPVAGTAVFVRAAGGSGESVLYKATISPVAGDFLAVFVFQTEGAATPTAVTDNLGTAYTKDCDLTYNQGFGLRRLTVYHLLNAPSGITAVSITPNKPSRGIVAEYSGMPASGSVLDVCGTVNTQTTASTTWTSTATTTTTNDLVFGLADTGFATNAGFTPTGAWTGRLAQHDSVDVDDSYMDDQLNVAASTYTATGTTSASVPKSSVVIAFKTSVTPVTSVTLNPASVVGGISSTGTVTLSAPAPTGGANVTLMSSNTTVATVVSPITVAAGAVTGTFTISTTAVTANATSLISATYNSATQSATLTVTPPPTTTFVRAAGGKGESAKYTVSIAPSSGDFLAVFVWQVEGASTPSAVTDNLGTAYTKDCDLTYNQGFGSRRLTVYHVLSAPSGITGISITPNKASRGIVAEYSGLTSAAGLDVCGTANTQTTGATSWSSTATTTLHKDLIFGLADTGFSAAASYKAGGVWTGRLEQPDTVDVDDGYLEDQINVPAGSYTATGTTTASVPESAVVVAFKTGF